MATAKVEPNERDVIYQRSIDEYNGGDAAAAVLWCERAAHLGHITAMCTLGAHYLVGEGIAADSMRAAGWFIKAAEAGDAKAQCNLAVLFLNGIGVTKDEAAAKEWCKVSAEAGEADGQHNLACMFLNGEGGPVDLIQARKWFSQAAAQGHTDAKSALNKLGTAGIVESAALNATNGATLKGMSQCTFHVPQVFECVD